MASIFDKYPDLVLYDATYKMNDREMPLFIQSVVDGNGITEIVTLAICKSESRAVIEFVLDCFKEENPNWTKIRCVIGDKDFADRVVYKEKFVGVALQICLFHVLRTFNREISAKRGINQGQRQKALQILQRLCYASTEEYYNEQYEELCKLNIDSVTEYYNTNWHGLRQEWTLFGKNEYSNYLNTTNNRSETMNQKVKSVGTRNSNLLTFFENLPCSVSVLASEKDIKAVRNEMRTARIRFDNVDLLSYYEFLTPFIFSKIQLEFEMSEKVNFTSIDKNVGITISERTVTISKCCCEFHLSMALPCRHILRFRKENKMQLFAPELCAPRWTAQYYKESHPALQMNVPIPATVPIYIQKVRIPEERDRYRAAASITKEINTLVSTMATGEYTFYLDKLKDLKNKIVAPAIENEIANESGHSFVAPAFGNQVASENGISFQGVVNSTENAQMVQPNLALDVLDLSLPNASSTVSSPIVIVSNSIANTYFSPESHMVASGSSPMQVNGPSLTETNCSTPMETNGLHMIPAVQANPNESRLIIFAPKPRDIQEIKLPYKHKSAGRPKGSIKNTVIGTKRKTNSHVEPSSEIRHKISKRLKANSTVTSLSESIHTKRSERIAANRNASGTTKKKRKN